MTQDYNEYIYQWKDWVDKEKNALDAGDLDSASQYAVFANKAYEDYTNHTIVTNQWENKTFGEINKIFENNLPTLFKENKKLVKEYVKMLKEDKNLLAQKSFFTALENFQEGNDAKEYVTETYNLIFKNIDLKSINESNKKIAKFIAKYYPILEENVSDENVELYENCNYFLTNKRKISNLNEMNNSMKHIINHITKNAKTLNENKVDVDKLVNEFNAKHKNTLNEAEQSFVQEIINAKKDSDNAKQKKMYEKFKNECIEQINKLMAESNETEKATLLNVKEQLLNKEFCFETIIQDFAKLLEIRDVLMS